MQKSMAASGAALRCWRKKCGSRADVLYRPSILILLVLTFTCCTVNVQDAMPGVYTAEWTTEFARVRDTVTIGRPAEKGSMTYPVTRRTCIIEDGIPKYKRVHWTALFDSRNKTLVVSNNGRLMSFDTQRHEMTMGKTIYKKI